MIAEEPRVDAAAVTELAKSLETELARLIVGQQALVRDTVIALLAGGHGFHVRHDPMTLRSALWRVPLLLGCLIVPLLFVLRRSLRETADFSARRHRPDTAEILR